MAQFERELIRERTNAGLKAARTRGRVGGKPKRLSEKQIKMAKSSWLRNQLKKRVIASHTTYRQVIELQARHLARVLMAQEDVYHPFHPKRKLSDRNRKLRFYNVCCIGL